MASLSVRPIQLRDLRAVRDLTENIVPLDLPRGRIGESLAEALAVVPGFRRSRRSFLAISDGAICGLMELRADPPNHRWVVTRVALDTKSSDAVVAEDLDAAVTMLGEQAARVAGSVGAKRVHAGFPEDAEIIEGLQNAGFEPYARETVYQAAGFRGARNALVRSQEPSDVWLIHQLYHLVTPRPVQYAEALTSGYWDTNERRGGAPRGYVIEDGLELSAYCRVRFSAGRYLIRVMAQPDARDLIEPLLRDVVARSGVRPGDQLLVFVPDFLMEYATSLEAVGFQPVARQVRLVKYTTVPQRVRLRAAERAVTPVRERVPARTPTYLVWKNSEREVKRQS